MANEELREEIATLIGEYSVQPYTGANKILALIEKAGFVKFAKDQVHEQARVEGILREIEIIILSELNQNLNLYPWWRVLKEREVGK